MPEELKCKQCGGDLVVDENNNYGTCIYCGTKYQLQHQTNSSLTAVVIDGIATTDSKLTRAHQLIQENNLEAANKLYKEILIASPENPYAWWGRYLCESSFSEYYGYKDKYGNSGIYTKAQIISQNLNLAYSAIAHASAEIAEEYKKIIAEKEQFVEAVKNGTFDTKNAAGKSGCYIATAVYGSYNCPQVMFLRKYRDDYLATFKLGRLFIQCYYAISPHLVHILRKNNVLNRFVRNKLDIFIEKQHRRFE